MYPVEFLTNGVGWNGVHEQLTPVITKPNGTKEYQVSDHLASLRVAIEGGAERHIDYDPWGTPTGAVAGERQTFNAQEQEHDTKLFDLTDRKYDAMIGGFGSPDRLWEADRSRSPYVYCANNPLGMTDPGGMQGKAVQTAYDEEGHGSSVPAEKKGSVVGRVVGGAMLDAAYGILKTEIDLYFPVVPIYELASGPKKYVGGYV